MPKTGQEFVDECRRVYLADFPHRDFLVSDITAAATTLTIGRVADFLVEDWIEANLEVMYVTNKNSTDNTLTVKRAQLGSVATAHSAGTPILRRPIFYTMDILESINSCIREHLYPWFYQIAEDETHTTERNIFEYAAPLGTKRILCVQLRDINNIDWSRPLKSWTQTDTVPPKVRLLFNPLSGRKIRMRVVKGFVTLATLGADNHGLPDIALSLPSLFAAARLLPGREILRARFDKVPTQLGERSSPVQSSIRLSQQLYALFMQQREESRMPWPTVHVRKRRVI